MKPGQLLKKFDSKSGREVTLRFIDELDAKGTMKAINSVIAENNYIIVDKKITLKDEQSWVATEVKNLRDNKKVQVLALVGDRIIGNCGIQKHEGHKSHTGTFGITLMKEYRGDGIGYELSLEATKQAKKNLNVELLKLGGVYEDNKRAKGLYKKLGFADYGMLPKSIKIGNKRINEYFMYKEL